jgi:spore germination protein KC
MKRFIKITALFLLINISLLFFCSCWDLQELDILSIVTGIGIDAGENEEDINLIYQVGRIGQSSSGSSSGNTNNDNEAFINYEATGNSYQIAINKIKLKMSRKPFLHDNQIVVFGREQVERGINDCLDKFYREKDIRMEVMMSMADTTAKDILEANVGPEKISATTLYKILNNTNNISKNLTTNFFSFLKGYIEPATSLLLPIIKLVKTEKSYEYEYSGMAVLKNTKLIGEIDNTLIDGYLWVKGDIKQKELSIKTKDKNVDLKLANFETKTTPVLENDGSLSVNVNLTCKAIITDVQGYQDEPIDNFIDYFETLTIDKINNDIYNCLAYVQSINADIYGIGDMFHKHMKHYWHTIENDWDNIFPDVKIKTNIKVEIINEGSINGGILKEKIK